ncbi:glutathione S-transferase C-terminal-like protein [Cubamyces sp. BRFM 1775]|nr:glutathione S-transferase C-terminal-like protein [Cubamyces sp. BRFM 1775]
MTQTKPFTLYGDVASLGPNPIKVAIVLEELGLEYNVVPYNTVKGEQKNPKYLKFNPNGRTPTLVDHSNGDFVIWESNAILLYLIEKYDPEHKLSVADVDAKYTLVQWLFFQSSGQGPYFGQAFWFRYQHSEKVPSALERYQKEILRVFGVLESVLSKQEWLVGGRLTVADLSFITWNVPTFRYILHELEGVNVETQFPAFYRWHQKLCERPVVARLLAAQVQFQENRG